VSERGPAVAPALEARNLCRSYGPHRVLRGLDLRLERGEVHVLAGENGAGKSTLVRVLSGADDRFEGELLLGGRPFRPPSPAAARRAGVATIHQELSLVRAMSIEDNLFLGQAPGPLSWRRSRRAEARALLARLGLDVDPACGVEQLSLAQQQLVEIARALALEATVVIMDEPTSALGEPEARALFERIRALRDGGTAVLYISHRMAEIFALADRITVLRDGASTGTELTSRMDRDELVRRLLGPARSEQAAPSAAPAARRAEPSPTEPDEQPGELLSVEGLSLEPAVGRAALEGVSLRVGRGEIVGVAGLEGSGASELLGAIFGAFGPLASGTIAIGQRAFVPRSPRASLARGVALLARDRKAQGLLLARGIIENTSLSSLARLAWPGWGWVDRGAERREVAEVARTLGVRAPSLDAAAGELSGGNQQKVYLGRCWMLRPSVLLLDEPTRGIDIGAKLEIHRLLRSWAAQGVAVLVSTSELEELQVLADRIVVLHRGRLVAELAGGAPAEAILSAAMGHDVPPGAGRALEPRP
jgi:ribose transport system ATP-binding protein